MSFCVEGLDPGSKGAVAFLYPDDGILDVFDLPTFQVDGTKRTMTYADGVGLADLVEPRKPAHAYLEKVHAMAGEGPVGAFTFGDNFGTLKGVHNALRVPLTLVSPQVWKANLKVPKDKKQAVARARELFPACSSLFTRPDRAEAALIGFYGLLHLGHAPKRRFEPRK